MKIERAKIGQLLRALLQQGGARFRLLFHHFSRKNASICSLRPFLSTSKSLEINMLTYPEGLFLVHGYFRAARVLNRSVIL